MNIRNRWWIVAFTLLIAIGVSEHFWPFSSSNISAPTDWKTYTNASYGFSVQYPKEYVVSRVSVPNGVEITIASPDVTQAPIVFTLSSQPFNGVYDITLHDVTGYSPVQRNTTIAGVNAKEITYTTPEGATATVTLFYKGTTTFLVMSYPGTQPILSTLKFTK